MSTKSSTVFELGLKTIFAAVAFAALAQPIRAADAPPPDTASRQRMEQRLQDAQERLEQAAREVADLSMSLNEPGRPQIFRFTTDGPQRPMLGMNIAPLETGAANANPGMNPNINSNNNSGVRVVSVSPGGPAEAAGIKANDVIVSFNGKALRGENNRTPQQQLLSLIAETKAGEAVAIEYRRDGKVQKTQITPKNFADFATDSALPRLPDLDLPPGLSRRLFIDKGSVSGFGSAELVELSPELGKYFGTDKGLLVVRAPRDQWLKLQDGDVILDIDGRTPNGVAHAYQILSSYRSGEKLKLHIMRQQKRIELPVEMPADAG